MRVICTAVVEDERQKSNLCECVGILGGKPQVSGNTVCVEYDGPERTASKYMSLFEQFPNHEVSIALERR